MLTTQLGYTLPILSVACCVYKVKEKMSSSFMWTKSQAAVGGTHAVRTAYMAHSFDKGPNRWDWGDFRDRNRSKKDLDAPFRSGTKS